MRRSIKGAGTGRFSVGAGYLRMRQGLVASLCKGSIAWSRIPEKIGDKCRSGRQKCHCGAPLISDEFDPNEDSEALWPLAVDDAAQDSKTVQNALLDLAKRKVILRPQEGRDEVTRARTSRTEINRANAQNSTGPRTEAVTTAFLIETHRRRFDVFGLLR